MYKTPRGQQEKYYMLRNIARDDWFPKSNNRTEYLVKGLYFAQLAFPETQQNYPPFIHVIK